MEYLSILSTIVLLFYVFIICIKFGIPSSISESYYKLQPHKLGWIFTIICWLVAFTFMPILFEVTPEVQQFLIFLMGGGLCFVGAAPLFKIKPDRLVHCIGASICMISVVIWSLLNCFYIPIITYSIYLIGTGMYMNTKKIKYKETNPIFWIEITTFITLFLTYLF